MESYHIRMEPYDIRMEPYGSIYGIAWNHVSIYEIVWNRMIPHMEWLEITSVDN